MRMQQALPPTIAHDTSITIMSPALAPIARNRKLKDIMKALTAWFVLIPLALVGCNQQTATPVDADAASEVADSSSLGDPSADSDAAMAAAAGEAIPLTPENTTIQFVGVHADPNKPDPRTGKFEKFTGSIAKSDAGLQSITVEIDTPSVTTEIDKLTNHLKSADFFNVNEHPKATFKSTKIEAASEGKVNITGDLTLLGNTQSITFPAMVSTEEPFSLKAEFQIDRTQFGMDYGTDNVKKEVDMTITVGG